MQYSSGFKGRFVEHGEKVLIYRNLNNGKWSIKAAQGPFKGKVVGHFDAVSLKGDATESMIKISVASQARARREKTRNVHCYIVGELTGVDGDVEPLGQRITYIPFEHDSFVYAADGEEWCGKAKEVNFIEGKCFVA